MRSTITKWVLGVVAFCLPPVVAAIVRRLDHSAVHHHDTYRSLVMFAALGSLFLAAVVPAILLAQWRAPVWQRIACVLGVWGLLALELYWTLFTLVVIP